MKIPKLFIKRIIGYRDAKLIEYREKFNVKV